MSGVTRANDGSWSWIAPCGASGAEHATSRDLTRDDYATHRKSCRGCGAQAPVAAVAAVARGGTAVKSRVVSKAERAATKPTAAVASKVKAAKPVAVARDLRRDGDAQYVTKFTALVRAAADADAAWRAVRREFPRSEWGKIRDIARRLTPHATWMAAYRAITGK